MFIRRHYEGVTEQMASSVARELAYAISVVETEAGEEAAARLALLSRPLGIAFRLEPGGGVAPDATRRFFDVTGGVVAETFRREIRRPMALDLVSSDRLVEARIQTDVGVLVAEVDRRRMIATNPHQLLVVMGIAAMALVTVAVLFLRNQVRPIRELAAAADAFGKGWSLRFTPRGAEEVRRAGAAFLAMRARIERQIESRTLMLSGVSHDLRTPLTRMKLALEMMEPSPERDELAEDVRAMERMIDEFLAFARGEAGEAAEETDPAEVAGEAVDAARRGGAVVALRLEGAPAATPMRRGAVRRALQNLLSNAAAHGRTVELTLSEGRAWVDYVVEDDGPGIPPDLRETALKPFARLDGARNQDKGAGVGLGLAIAADVARAHGGALTLESGERLGGLRVRLRLPR
ncbi:MAG: HAMP domain-containing protein [Rhodobacteraceae bacterium]|nr:MAG: HAMP domain-containing protein [Paracoccaceae bacterium]